MQEIIISIFNIYAVLQQEELIIRIGLECICLIQKIFKILVR